MLELLLENHRAFLRYLENRVGSRAMAAFAREMQAREDASPDMEREICACMLRLAGTLKAEYAEALRAIDVEGMPVKTFAQQHGWSASNAGLRHFGATCNGSPQNASYLKRGARGPSRPPAIGQA